MALVSPSWSSWAGTVRVAVGGLCAQCRPSCPRPDPMALVTVSRSPPASGYSTPVGPTVSLALLWSCPRSWLPAGPWGARPAYRQPLFKAGGVGQGTPGLRLEGIGGVLRLPETSTKASRGPLSARSASGGPTPFVGQIWAKL